MPFIIAFAGALFLGIIWNAWKKGNEEHTKKPQVKAKPTFDPPKEKKNQIISLDLPFEILPNLYSLSIKNKNIQNIINYYSDGSKHEHIAIQCEIHYKMNGRKEGKRRFVFSFYDENNELICFTSTKEHRLTEAGVVMVYAEKYGPWKRFPQKISISVEEV